MKLLVACSAPTDGGGGISAYARTLAVALREVGHEVHYACPQAQDTSFIAQHGLVHVPTDPDAEPRAAAAGLLAHIEKHGVEGSINNDNPVLQSIAPAIRTPLVTVCHMDRRIVATLCTLHGDWIDHLVCISSDMIATMSRRYGFPITKCRLVYNGAVDPGHSGNFEPTDPKRLKLVCATGWNRNKGGPRILDSILKHPDVWRRVDLDWFGAVPEAVQKKAAQLPNVRFRGRVPQAAFHQALAQADALVFASAKEGCPMTMLEAMSHGVLPIATDGVGAMRWLIDAGREGFICSLRDWSEQLSACVRYLADQPGLVAEMKRAARARYLRDFQAGQNAEAMLELLRQPTVDRTRPEQGLPVVRWHRPMGRRLTLMERLRYRTGWLDMAGPLPPLV